MQPKSAIKSSRQPNITALPAGPGFTLIELMIVVALIAVVATLTATEIYSNSNRLKNTAYTLRAKMQQAKLRAVKKNCNTFVDFDLDDNGAADSGYSIWQDANGDNTFNSSPSELIETISLPGRVSFGAVPSSKGGPTKSASNSGSTPPTANIISFSGDRVRFTPLGSASNGWAYLYMPQDYSAGTYAVGSNNSGRIQIRKWNTGGRTWR